MGAARYVANGASDGALDELVAEARKDATLMAARVTRSGGTLTSHGVIVWKPASTASGRRVYKLGKPYSQWAAVWKSKLDGAFVLNRHRRLLDSVTRHTG